MHFQNVPRVLVSAFVATRLVRAAATPAPSPNTELRTASGLPALPVEAVLDPKIDPKNPENLEARREIEMIWRQSDAGLVTVNGTMKLPTIMFERVQAIQQVSCDERSLTITFGDNASRQEASDKWPKSEFLVVTNNGGQCDEPQERGVHIVSNAHFAEDSTAISFDRKKSTFAESSESMTITTKDMKPVSENGLSKRLELGSSDSSYRIDFDIPDVEFGDQDSPVKVKVIPGKVSYLAVISAKIETEGTTITSGLLTVMTVGKLKMGVEVGFAGEFAKDFNHRLPTIPLTPLYVPGLITIGPAIEPSIGIELAAAGEIKARFEVESDQEVARHYVDMLNSSKSVSYPPDDSYYTAKANVIGSVTVEANPYVDMKLAVVAEIPGGIGVRAGVGAMLMMENMLLADIRTGDQDEEVDTDKTSVKVPGLIGKKKGHGRTEVEVAPEEVQDCPNGILFKSEAKASVYAFVDASAGSLGEVGAKYNLFQVSDDLYKKCFESMPEGGFGWRVDDNS